MTTCLISPVNGERGRHASSLLLFRFLQATRARRPVLVNPALSLCPHLQLLGDFLGRPLGRAFDGGPPAHLTLYLKRAADDEPDRVATGHGHGKGQSCPRSLRAGGVELRGTEPP